MSKVVFACVFGFLTVSAVPAPSEAAPFALKPLKPARHCVSLRDVVSRIAVAEKVPPWLFCELVEIESRWNPQAVNINKNGTIDRGLYQINTTAHPGVNVADIVESGHYAAKYLRGLYDRLGSWRAALEAYNCGPGRWRQGAPERSREYARMILSNEPKGRMKLNESI